MQTCAIAAYVSNFKLALGVRVCLCASYLQTIDSCLWAFPSRKARSMYNTERFLQNLLSESIPRLCMGKVQNITIFFTILWLSEA